MRYHAIARILGMLALFIAGLGLAPLAADWGSGAPITPWLVMVGSAITTALLLLAYARGKSVEFGIREGVATTVLVWLLASLLGGIGIWLATPAGFIAAWFEGMSGFTTTGATVFGGEPGDPWAIASQSAGTLLWRSLMQWLGGLGIVVISLALLPLLGGEAGFRLFQAEVPGIETDRLAPRIQGTARILLRLYVILTAVVAAALMLCGATAFDALCHAMTTVATGGFSTFDNSVEGLNSVAAEWCIILGMFVCGLNFAVLLRVLRGQPGRFWNSEETRLYSGLILAAAALMAWQLAVHEPAYAGRWHDLIRDAIFQAVAITTSTGYASGYDTVPGSFGAWPPACGVALIFLMICGGCAGSTAGGFKVVRFLLIGKLVRRTWHSLLQPGRIVPLHIDGHRIGLGLAPQVLVFLFVYICSWLLGTLLLTCFGADILTACMASLSSLSNIGPGLGGVGPAEHFRHLTPAAHFTCIVLMLLGRLELLGAIWLMRPAHWRPVRIRQAPPTDHLPDKPLP